MQNITLELTFDEATHLYNLASQTLEGLAEDRAVDPAAYKGCAPMDQVQAAFDKLTAAIEEAK